MGDSLEKKKKEIMEKARREVEELDLLARLAEKHGLSLGVTHGKQPDSVEEVEEIGESLLFRPDEIAASKRHVAPVEVDNNIGRVRRHGKSWTQTILDELEGFDRGATRQQLKDKLRSTHLGQRLQETEAAFYGSIAKLKTRGKLKEYKARLFKPSQLRQFLADVEAKKVRDIKYAPPSTRSVARDFVLQFLEGKNNVSATEIFEQLQEDHPGVLQNKNSIYNLLARMMKNKEIVKDDGLYSLPHNENDPPLGGSDTEGAATPSNDSPKKMPDVSGS